MQSVKADDDKGRAEGADGGGAAAAAPLAKSAGEMERKLLEFESELDATMLRVVYKSSCLEDSVLKTAISRHCLELGSMAGLGWQRVLGRS